MSASCISMKSAWPVLAAAGLGLVAGFLLRPNHDTHPASTLSDGSLLLRGNKNSPLGRPRSLPQTELRLAALRNAGPPSAQIAAALDFAQIASIDEIRDLLQNSHRFPSHSAEEVAIGTLLKRWLELDSAGALDYCQANKAHFLPKLLTNWAQEHPDEAGAWVRAMPPGIPQKSSWLGLCAAAAARDPDKAWEMLAKTPGLDPRMGGWEMESSIQAMVGRDVEKALASLGTMPPVLLMTAQKKIAEHLMKMDPARAWAWVTGLPQREAAAGAALTVVVKRDPAQALAFMKNLPTGELLAMIPRHAYKWGGAGTKNFLALLRQDAGMDASIKQKIVQHTFSPYISSDPATALETISLMSEPFQKSSMQGSVANWATFDPAASRAWVESLPEGSLRNIALEAQNRSETKDPPAGAASPESLVAALKRADYIQPSDPRLELVTTELLGKIMQEGQLTGNDHQRGQLFSAIGQTNPSVAAAWLQSTTLDSKTGPMAARFSAEWAQEDPAGAAAWVINLPSGNLAVNAASNVALQYHRYAPDEAIAWMAQLPPGPVQDAARGAVTGR